MSSSNSSSQQFHQKSLSFESGLIIAVGVLGLMMVLVVLRLFCNFCIDVTIADEDTRAMSLLRYLCPWCRPRTSPGHEESSPEELELQQEINLARSGMSPEEWKSLIHSILPSKKVIAKDLATWKEMQGCSNEKICEERGEHSCSNNYDNNDINIDNCAGLLCSICLHDIEIGESAVSSTSCQHVFHTECIINWLKRSLACPYCRTDMISRERLHAAIRSRSHP